MKRPTCETCLYGNTDIPDPHPGREVQCRKQWAGAAPVWPLHYWCGEGAWFPADVGLKSEHPWLGYADVAAAQRAAMSCPECGGMGGEHEEGCRIAEVLEEREATLIVDVCQHGAREGRCGHPGCSHRHPDVDRHDPRSPSYEGKPAQELSGAPAG